jgi:hypothetical protein
MSAVKLIVNRLRGYKPGQIIDCAVDVDGVIKDRFWRRRLRDSARDACVSLVVEAVAEAVTAEKQRKKKEVNENGNDNP